MDDAIVGIDKDNRGLAAAPGLIVQEGLAEAPGDETWTLLSPGQNNSMSQNGPQASGVKLCLLRREVRGAGHVVGCREELDWDADQVAVESVEPVTCLTGVEPRDVKVGALARGLEVTGFLAGSSSTGYR